MHRCLTLVACGLLSAAPLAAAELPIRKAGLWELKMSLLGGFMPPMRLQHCTDSATDKLMTSGMSGPVAQACSAPDVQNVAGTYTVTSVCSMGPFKMTSNTVITGNFHQGYTAKVTQKPEGSMAAFMAGAGDETLTIEAKWLGACKTDQKPGDMIMENGMKVNVRDMSQMPQMPGMPGQGGFGMPGMPMMPGMPGAPPPR
jgi:hypothetical protein